MRLIAIFSLVFAFVTTLSSMAADAIAKKPELLPKLELTVPDNDFYRSYLGLKGSPGEKFSLTQVEADILVIELFSMYCPYCQKEAPMVNELYEKMASYKTMGLEIKIIGIGVSNSQFEVEHFRDSYKVPFPLFPDKDMAMYKALKGSGTPGFLGVHLPDGDGAAIVLRNSGGIHNSDDFLKKLVKNSGL